MFGVDQLELTLVGRLRAPLRLRDPGRFDLLDDPSPMPVDQDRAGVMVLGYFWSRQ